MTCSLKIHVRMAQSVLVFRALPALFVCRPHAHVLQVGSMDAVDMSWSPNGSCLAVQDSSLTYRVFLLGADGSSLGSYV